MNDIQTEIDYLHAQFNAIRAEVMPSLRRFKARGAYKCRKGYNCGGSCISRGYGCRKALDGEAKNFGEWMVQKMSANMGAALGEAPKDKPKSPNLIAQKLDEIPTNQSRLRTKKEREALKSSYEALIDEVEKENGDNPEAKKSTDRARGALRMITNVKMHDVQYQRSENAIRENILNASQQIKQPLPRPPAPIDLNTERKKRRPEQAKTPEDRVKELAGDTGELDGVPLTIEGASKRGVEGKRSARGASRRRGGRGATRGGGFGNATDSYERTEIASSPNFKWTKEDRDQANSIEYETSVRDGSIFEPTYIRSRQSGRNHDQAMILSATDIPAEEKIKIIEERFPIGKTEQNYITANRDEFNKQQLEEARKRGNTESVKQWEMYMQKQAANRTRKNAAHFAAPLPPSVERRIEWIHRRIDQLMRQS